MAQRRSAGWMRGSGARGMRVWMCALGVAACVLVGGTLWMRTRAGASFVVERTQGEQLQESDNAQEEVEADGFEQFQHSSSNTQDTSSNEVNESHSLQVVIDVDGAVRAPGVYELEGETLRVNDAVTAAGGLAEDADTTQVNLAAPVEDGAKVYIPRMGEDVPEGAGGAMAGLDVGSVGGAPGTDSTLVNINTATNEELQGLPGVGEATADAIVRDREANGPFSSPEDIMRVSGIGEKKFERMRAMICV